MAAKPSLVPPLSELVEPDAIGVVNGTDACGLVEVLGRIYGRDDRVEVLRTWLADEQRPAVREAIEARMQQIHGGA